MYQIGDALSFDCFYTASKVGKTGLTVTVDIYNHAGVKVVNNAAASELGGGFYGYAMSGTFNSGAGNYRSLFKTSDGTVDRQHLPGQIQVGAGWVQNVDASINSRLPTASYTAPDNASITAIKAKTDNLPADPADESQLEAAITAATAPLMTASSYTAPDNASVAAIKVVTDGLSTAMETDGAVKRFTANALEMAPGGGGSVTVVARVAVSAIEAALVASGKLGFIRYYSFSESIPSNTTEALNTATEIWLAIKHTKDVLDTDSILLISMGNGLEILNGSPYSTTEHGTLVIAGTAGEWYADVDVTHDVTPSLPLGSYYAELKVLLSNGRTIQAWAGKAEIKEGLIKATV